MVRVVGVRDAVVSGQSFAIPLRAHHRRHAALARVPLVLELRSVQRWDPLRARVAVLEEESRLVHTTRCPQHLFYDLLQRSAAAEVLRVGELDHAPEHGRSEAVRKRSRLANENARVGDDLAELLDVHVVPQDALRAVHCRRNSTPQRARNGVAVLRAEAAKRLVIVAEDVVADAARLAHDVLDPHRLRARRARVLDLKRRVSAGSRWRKSASARVRAAAGVSVVPRAWSRRSR